MLDQPIIECVPNISEGRRREVIDAVAAAAASVEGVRLLDVDPGHATNRTVITFVGPPEKVVEAAFRLAARAKELIDMRSHQGAHPRMGAVDVMPLVPVANISMEETAEWARKLGRRIGEELGVPVYLYEEAATRPERRNLAAVRAGEYEALPQKLEKEEWRPDFGPARFVPSFGAVAVGARDFLIAYNINLNTRSVRRANSVAFDVRERGRLLRKGHPLFGEPIKDDDGHPLRIPGSLKGVKAIGWYIDEYGIAQISMNITRIRQTPLHVVFEEVERRALARGMRVTGSEIVGLVPLKVLLDAGRYFLKRQNLSRGVSEEDLLFIARKTLGLDELAPFEPEKKIIEYRLVDRKKTYPLNFLTVRDFVNEVAADSPAPGGGSVSALIGALGTALNTMVANLSAHKRGWDDRVDFFSEYAEKGQHIKDRLLALIDEDTRAFNAIMTAFRLPKGSAEEKKARAEAIEKATQAAAAVPYRIMQTAFEAFDIAEAMLAHGLPASFTDAGVGAQALLTAVRGAYYNVMVNLKDVKDKAFREDLSARAAGLLKQAEARAAAIDGAVREKFAG